MAKQQGAGDWLVLEEKLERGDPSFVDDLRTVSMPKSWPASHALVHGQTTGFRRLLLAYLDRPMNAFRHEPLVKRLFKQAEAAGDDEVMAEFLVMFDRSVRREQRRRVHVEWRTVGRRPRHRRSSPVAQHRFR